MGLRVRLQSRAANVVQKVRDKRDERRERKYLETHPSLASDPTVADHENHFYIGLIECNEKMREIARKNSFDIDFVPQDPRYVKSKSVAELNRELSALATKYPSDIKASSVPDVAAACWEMLCALTDHLNNLGFTATRYPDSILDEVESAMRAQTPKLTFASDPRLQWLVTTHHLPTLQPRKSADAAYGARLASRRYEPHVAPFNKYVDDLRRERREWVPYVAPTFGGVDARVLTLFQHTGPWAQLSGSAADGMISLEHQGNFAARHLAFLTGAGIKPQDVLSWNAYPWACNRRPTTGELMRGAPVIARVVSMMPRLAVVVLHGLVVHDAWQFAVNQNPELRRYRVIETYDTGSLVVSGDDSDENERRARKIADDLAAVSEALRAADSAAGDDAWGHPSASENEASAIGRDADGIPYLDEPPSEDEPPFPDEAWETSPPSRSLAGGAMSESHSTPPRGFTYQAARSIDLKGRVASIEAKPPEDGLPFPVRMHLRADDIAREHLLWGFKGQFTYAPRAYTANGELLCLDWEFGVPDDCRRIAAVLTKNIALQLNQMSSVDLGVANDWYKIRDPFVDSYSLQNTRSGECINKLKYRTFGGAVTKTAEFSFLSDAMFRMAVRHPNLLRAETIVGVPGHTATGTSVAELLAQSVAERAGKRYVRTFAPSRPARKGQNRRSVEGMFSIRSTLAGDCIVVDDVMLSGATLDETARAAREAGADRVFALVAAKTLRDSA